MSSRCVSIWCRSSALSGIESKANCTGRVVPAVTVSSRSSAPGRWVAIMKIVERPRWVSVNRRCVYLLRNAPTGMTMRRNTSSEANILRWSPSTKSTASRVRSDPPADHSS